MGAVAAVDDGPVALPGPAPRRPAPGGPRRWSRWLLLLGVPFGLFFALATPPMQEIDGVAHTLRVRDIAQGHLVARLNADDQAVTRIDDCTNGLIAEMFNRGGTPRGMSFRRNFQRPTCTTALDYDISNTAINAPVAYAPQALGYRLGNLINGPPGAIYVGRLFGLAAYLLLCWWALRITPRGHAVLFITALLPSSLALASYLSADGMGIALAILAVALALRAREQAVGRAALPAPSVDARSWHRTLAAFAVVLVLLALSKNLYGDFALLALLVPAQGFVSARARWGWRLGTIGAAFVPAWLWSALVVSHVHFHHTSVFGADSWEQAAWIQHNPGSFLGTIWSGLGSPWIPDHSLPGFVEVVAVFRPHFAPVALGDRAPLPLFAVACALILVALLCEVGGRRAVPAAGGDRAGALGRAGVVTSTAVVAVIVAVCVLLMYLGEALTTARVAPHTIRWIQGRYFLPLVPLLVLPVAAGTSARGGGRTAVWGWAVPATSLFLLVWVMWRVFVVFY